MSCMLKTREDQEQMLTSTPWMSKGKRELLSHHNINKTVNPPEHQSLSPTITRHPCRSTVIQEEMIPCGEDYSCHSPSLLGTQQETPRSSFFCSLSNIQLNLAEEDGCPLYQQTVTDSSRATYWALTTWEQDLTWERVLSCLSTMGPLVVSILQINNTCAVTTGDHTDTG